jgi:hypothetical protein
MPPTVMGAGKLVTTAGIVWLVLGQLGKSLTAVERIGQHEKSNTCLVSEQVQHDDDDEGEPGDAVLAGTGPPGAGVAGLGAQSTSLLH